MVTYYCDAESLEVIGTHKDWLKLREKNPERFNILRQARNSELVRIGDDYLLSPADKIRKFGLWEEHVRLCRESMDRKLAELKESTNQLRSQLTNVSGEARSILSDEVTRREETIFKWEKEIKSGSLRLESDDY
jgi:hypothetical protein